MAKYVNDVTRLTDTLYTGGGGSWSDTRRHALWVQDVLDTGITAIIDLMVENDPVEMKKFWNDKGIKYLHVGTTDAVGHHVPKYVFEDAWRFYNTHSAKGKVLVHCYMGVNRGPSVAFAILVASGMAPEKAFDLIRQQRPQAGIYYAEDALVWRYERKTNVFPTAAKTNLMGGMDAQQNRIARFRDHRDKVYPPAEQEKVLHLIQKRHDEDWRAATRG